jgi:hypothetical protein
MDQDNRVKCRLISLGGNRFTVWICSFSTILNTDGHIEIVNTETYVRNQHESSSEKNGLYGTQFKNPLLQLDGELC